ncbi:polysaccharide deacetylase family protein [Niabella ginsengisoli]|uniref:Polysaccharide deacetylase family protein n=1 Tax=Niabella ginsengisoli TaxID=522298 RepID=A0ABS9SGH3_9BACT|nr:polysaccharide deacetylase family protein [Niabella ginsengisoli]MCH5597468.1 polysaccharide deacetylase family protein [Niabella ginsengisoli]
MDGTASLSYYFAAMQKQSDRNTIIKDSEGAIIKLNSHQKKVYLLFSGHDLGEGGISILNTLKKHNIKGNFFFTGDFLRNKAFREIVKRVVDEGHYIGSHSDKHLLYADWSKRESLLVTKDSFQRDLSQSLQELKAAKATTGKWYLSPYEWYNKQTVQWCNENGLAVINFTTGTGTNADYTWPQLSNYRNNDTILTRLFEAERKEGLNGNLILIHIGTDERRKEKLYNELGYIIERLHQSGYSIERLP